MSTIEVKPSITEVKPSIYLKRLFHKAKELKNGNKLTFRKFVKKLVASGNEIAIKWIHNKSSQVNAEAKALRLKNKGAIIISTKNATKLSKKKKENK